MIFKDRVDAGKYLANLLKDFARQPDTIVLGLPRGGVPVAFEIAKALQLPLDIFLVRKIGMPGHEELAIGAIAEGNICYLNEEAIKQYQLNQAHIQTIIEQENKELQRRQQLYRPNRQTPHLKNKHIILVDDGIATGATMKAAIKSLRLLGASSIIIAIPVGAADTLIELNPLVDEVVCPYTPAPFYAVGQWYQSFPQTSDNEVIQCLCRLD